VPLDGRLDIQQDATAQCVLAVRQVRAHLESGASLPRPPNLPVRPVTAIAFSSWLAGSSTLLWIATRTGWVIAWLAFVLISLMPALMLMVLAQTPGRSAARLLHDEESGRS
jgi:hypothetical protein